VYPVMHYGSIFADQADAIRSAPGPNIDLTASASYAANGLGRLWRRRMSDKAIEDGLWSLHNAVTNRVGDGTAVMTANMTSTGYVVADTAIAMTAMQKRKHMAAYPPGTYRDNTPTATWLAENDLRYASDPYAEDLVRMFNFNLLQMSVVNVTAADEADDLSTPMPGTNDGFGLSFDVSQNAYIAGIAAEALATCGLAGTVAQVGDMNRILYKPIEVIAQQAVDYMVWFQNDGGSYPGSFYYTPNANAPDGSTSEWMYSGLYAMATSPMTAQGLYVNNLVKARIGSFLRQSMHTVAGPASSRPYGSGGFSYVPNNPADYSFQLSAGSLMAMGLMGWNNPLWEGSNAYIPNAVGFMLNVTSTRGQAYSAFRQVFDYIGDDWNTAGGHDSSSGWDVGQWQGGAGGYVRDDDDYNLYGIQWAARGLSAIGAVCVGGTEAQDANGACTDGNDWKHQQTVLLVRRQTVTNTGATWTPTRGPAVQNLGQSMKTAMAILTLMSAR